MDLLQYISDHHAQLYYLIAGISFVLELAVMGLGGPLLFFAIGCFVTAIFTSFGLISGWESEMFCIGVLTGLTALLLWRTLEKFQNSGGGPDDSSDMIGQKVPCVGTITKITGTIRYSGINWNARLDLESEIEDIPEGSQCVISGVDGNVMIVKPYREV